MAKTINMVGSINGGATSVLKVDVTNGNATSVTASNGSKTIELKQWGKVVPDGYTQLEYVQNTKGSSLGVSFQQAPYYQTLKFFTKIDLVSASTSDNQYLFSCFKYDSSASGNYQYRCLFLMKYTSDQSKYRFQYGYGATEQDISIGLGQHTISFDASTKQATIDSTTLTLSQQITIDDEVYVACSHFAKYYYVKIYDGSTVLYDLVPAMRNSDKAVGMYDIKNNIFYSTNWIAGPVSSFITPISSGSWTITATDGTHTNTREVNVDIVQTYNVTVPLPTLPDDYTQVEWVIGGINTGYQPVSACRIFGKQQSLRSSSETSYWDKWFGANISGAQIIYLELTDSNLIYYNSTTYGSIAFSRNLSTIYTYSTSGRTITINGSSYTVTSGNAITSPFGVNLTCGANKVKTWYFRITAPDTVTFVRDYYPAIRKSDSAIGMYDIINGTFAGCGSGASAGPAVSI